jgi:hypothetical protein
MWWVSCVISRGGWMGWIIDGWIGLALGLKYVNTE